MKHTIPISEASLREKAQQIVEAARRLAEIVTRMAEEQGVALGRLELELGALDEHALGARGLRWRLRVDERWFALPRGLEQCPDEEVSAVFREVLQGRPVRIDFTELNEAIAQLRPPDKP